MKKILYLLLFFPIFISSQSWQWAKFYGANCMYGERVNSIFSDGSNYYIVGSYGCQLYLPGGSTLFSSGTSDIFIAKFDASGSLIWANTIGGNFNQPSSYEDAYGVYDPINNCIYVGGRIIGSVNFPGGPIVNGTVGSSDVFVGRMDLNGNFSWVNTTGSYGIGGQGNDYAEVFVEPDGDVVLAGTIEDTCIFGSFNVPTGGFIARYNSNGTCKWAANKSGNGIGIHIDFMDTDMIIAASYNSTTNYFDTIPLLSNGLYDGLIARTDSTGKTKWIRKFGFAGDDFAEDVVVNSNNDIFLTGSFTDSLKFGTLKLVNAGKDVFVLKFDQNGNDYWGKKGGSNGSYGAGLDLAEDSTGGCYLSGIFTSSFSMDSYNANSSNEFDMFVTRLNSNGTCLGGVNFGVATGSNLCVDNNGAIYCAGGFKNTINIGSGTISSYDSKDLYVAKLDAITGINNNSKFSQNNSLTIYANPNKGTFNIKVPDEVKDFDGAVLLVYDKQGKEVGKFDLDEKSADKNHPHFDVSNTAPGTYIVKLVQKGKMFTGQLVLEE
jgi:hypothetical protein